MKKVLIISFTHVATSPRVVRQADFFLSNGFKVYVAGFSGKDKVDSRWEFINLSGYLPPYTYKMSPYLSVSIADLAKMVSNKKSRRDLIDMFFDRATEIYKIFALSKRAAVFAYWRRKVYWDIFEVLKDLDIDFIACHDYHTVPVAFELAARKNISYTLDSHEYGVMAGKTESFFTNILWFLFRKNYIHFLQKEYFPKAALITTVSQGIADLLMDDYKLEKCPTVIRSVPVYSKQEINKVKADKFSILYHGIASPCRGIEQIIEALSICKSNATLTLRSSWKSGYLEEIRRLVCKFRVEHKIVFEPLVAFQDIVQEASKFDIGIIVVPKISPQQEYRLPNKFFEYIMAGMALCVTDCKEMEEILKKYNLGKVIKGSTPEEIAKTIDSFDINSINEYKENCLKAAQELCWENESQKLKVLLKGI
ncbi:hypothetical protein [Candidatus Hydrogenosomobacter endosymbioticus]|uniref:Glycosyl transferase n=1 Tax=Candidatus Hydrogenosomobacter endosymbioticus TaxID=2558174 RepID=A0ABM7V9M4_9PROT|nr:hypothetical protein [Candidatus Hydrogenosomobacter endosymbioticus]BDB96493.1 glycosyl transferase [Candidatus Hydrogenosomobacter endosymbioticus]